jgi:hypothetical protein
MSDIGYQPKQLNRERRKHHGQRYWGEQYNAERGYPSGRDYTPTKTQGSERQA